jgi:hypothetical protein
MTRDAPRGTLLSDERDRNPTAPVEDAHPRPPPRCSAEAHDSNTHARRAERPLEDGARRSPGGAGGGRRRAATAGAAGAVQAPCRGTCGCGAAARRTGARPALAVRFAHVAAAPPASNTTVACTRCRAIIRATTRSSVTGRHVRIRASWRLRRFRSIAQGTGRSWNSPSFASPRRLRRPVPERSGKSARRRRRRPRSPNGRDTTPRPARDGQAALLRDPRRRGSRPRSDAASPRGRHMTSVVEMQEATAAGRSSCGDGPVPRPPTDGGSSVMSRCLLSTRTSWRRLPSIECALATRLMA